jgi:hypothetical protein
MREWKAFAVEEAADEIVLVTLSDAVAQLIHFDSPVPPSS